MRVPVDPNLPLLDVHPREYDRKLAFRLKEVLGRFGQQLNAITEGNQSAHHGANTTYPTTGTWGQGDFILNSAPSELGAAGSKYIIHGWRCTVSGSPGTWVQCRYLTGN